MTISTPSTRHVISSRSGGSLLVVLVAIVLAVGVFFWFAKIAGVSTPTPQAATSANTTEPFLELGSTQTVVTIPEYTVEDIQQLAEFLVPHEQTALDQSLPLLTVGQTVDVRQISGVVGRGEILALDDREVVQQQESVTNRIALTNLDAWDRLRTDRILRAKIAHYRALTQARQELETLGQLPTITFTNAEALQSAADTGEAKALNELGMRHVLGRGVEPEAGLGFFLIYQAALNGWAAAQYNLGVLYLKGVAVGQNAETGLLWIALAAQNGWKPAQDYLNENKVGQDRATTLAVHQAKVVRVETDASAARFESIKQESRASSLQAMGRTYRPEGITYADFKLRYYWWLSEAEPTFKTWFDEQGRRHLSLTRI